MVACRVQREGTAGPGALGRPEWVKDAVWAYLWLDAVSTARLGATQLFAQAPTAIRSSSRPSSKPSSASSEAMIGEGQDRAGQGTARHGSAAVGLGTGSVHSRGVLLTSKQAESVCECQARPRAGAAAHSSARRPRTTMAADGRGSESGRFGRHVETARSRPDQVRGVDEGPTLHSGCSAAVGGGLGRAGRSLLRKVRPQSYDVEGAGAEDGAGATGGRCCYMHGGLGRAREVLSRHNGALSWTRAARMRMSCIWQRSRRTDPGAVETRSRARGACPGARTHPATHTPITLAVT